MSDLYAQFPHWLVPLLAIAGAIVAALIVHRLASLLITRSAARVTWLAEAAVAHRISGPLRFLLIAIALAVVEPTLDLGPQASAIWRRAAGLLVPALIGWVVAALAGITFAIVETHADISVADNLAARRRRTRAAILHRIVIFVILLVTFCMMLMSIPAVRSIGVTLIASAGLAGLAIGAAAQPALKNLIAGVQLAFTEPIRIDDVVIIDGEWGRIEEIRLTFVVVRIWDDRRLVVPVSRFLEDSFQNWTRRTSQLLGTAFLHVDPAADVGRLRDKLDDFVRANPNWDGRVVGLQVTDTHPDHLQLRALVSASDAGKAFDLRCDVREAMMRFIREEMPEAIVRRRAEVDMTAATPHG